MRGKQISNILPESVRTSISKSGVDFKRLQEIRMREGKNLFVKWNGSEFEFLQRISREVIQETLGYIANYSLYAYEKELRQGFLTITGGHRVGVAGKIILDEGKVRNWGYISSINIRVCHEILGCADKLFPQILKENRLVHTLIISPPGCGKTTLLRDLVRQMSDGNSYLKGENVGVVDERSEIGGCYQGVPQNQIGKRTDIIDGCPKDIGMIMMIRSMSPQVLAVDEIGTKEDIDAVFYAMNCGITIFATVHGNSVAEVQEKIKLKFERYVVLKKEENVGVLEGIYNRQGKKLC